MVGMKQRHGRRKRRQAKMALKGKFKVRHRNKAGRTGSVHAKKTKG